MMKKKTFYLVICDFDFGIFLRMYDEEMIDKKCKNTWHD